jgi:hypothetical protein
MATVLSAAAILAADDLKREFVPTPEWGGAGAGVYVRVLPGELRDAIEAAGLDAKGQPLPPVQKLKNFRARFLALAVVDEAGQRIFRDDQIDALGSKSSVALLRLWEVANRLNPMSKQDIEEMAGNSETGPSAGSGSS